MDSRWRFPVTSRPSPGKMTAAAALVPNESILLASTLISFFFFASAYYLMGQWRDKIRTFAPLLSISSTELAAISAFIMSALYLLNFFGLNLACLFSSPNTDDGAGAFTKARPVASPPLPKLTGEKADIVAKVVSGAISSYSLETRLGDCRLAAEIRRLAVEATTGRSLEGLPLDGLDYESVLGQCCEMPVGYIQIPVGIAGPLQVDGQEFMLPMATTEGCLVASTNRGCKAIALSGGASAVVLKDAMTRAPAIRFATIKRAAELKFFVEDPINFETLAVIFNK